MVLILMGNVFYRRFVEDCVTDILFIAATNCTYKFDFFYVYLLEA